MKTKKQLKDELNFERSRTDLYKQAYDSDRGFTIWWMTRANQFQAEISLLRKENNILKAELSDYKAGLK